MTAGGYAQRENELEEDLLDQVQTCLGAVLEQFGDAAMPLMEGLMPQIGVLLTPKSSVEEKRVGICIMDDIMEHTQEGEPVLPFCSAPPSPLYPGRHPAGLQHVHWLPCLFLLQLATGTWCCTAS